MGKAAVHQPALAILSHTPAGATETICWVGKGIVYDTGGLSIKGKVSLQLDCARSNGHPEGYSEQNQLEHVDRAPL